MKLVRLGVLTLLAGLAACSKLTVENYDMLKAGMSYAEVTQLLGDPAKCDDALGLRQCTWGDDKRHIKASFAADRLVVRTAAGIGASK